MACMSVIHELSRTLSKGNVLTGEENTRPFECDGLSVYRQKPLAVVLPQSVEQIKQVLKICKAHNTPVVTRGAGTGLSGGAMPLEESVV
ncbi:FAD-binding protein, partial [bacterium endosymbiont of Bathymodiolus sp. 5 South]|uniref:FAD-binding protein n=1 Tax=bacterium endosymbiont of Bathymodiolus sp. 5 South TaxID=1181670 RepID=UPI00214B1809